MDAEDRTAPPPLSTEISGTEMSGTEVSGTEIPRTETPPTGLPVTEIPDWAAICPELSHTGFRLYCILRSLAGPRARPAELTLTLDQLAHLMPGPQGKPCGRTAVKDALASLEGCGLVSARRRVVTSRGAGSIKAELSFRVNEVPPSYEVPSSPENSRPRSVREKAAAYEPGWRQFASRKSGVHKAT
ncbi:hypothetical protein AB0Q95_35975 [Streptomyces sp. NPDC059900]|uniref:hypothetical protein n=1 Tax=Streptomyces sp. NPDC059900 TaxID=3155816 RepID=UPI003447ABCB